MFQLNNGKLDFGKDAKSSSSLQADCWTIMSFVMAISTAQGTGKTCFTCLTFMQPQINYNPT